MRFKTIDFPPEILQSHKDGKLVIFAGAGVSMPPPAKLPDFVGLAREIGGKANPKLDDEAEDRYLGRLHDDGRGVHVHDIAAKILLDPNSKPTALHSLLLELFIPEVPIRLVTTNFDDHFTSAAKKFDCPSVEIFCAPALPLGDNFEGIVYLHGSAARAPNNLVLTDSDFGRAYLTYGWASRFLYQLFSSYTVLFVGYSHNDIVMRYLARGLPPETRNKRFAILPRETDATWAAYGINALHYDKREGENGHSAITESIQEWVDECHRGLLARSERIRSIVAAAPPLEGEDADYLKYSLGNADNARQFAKHTKLPSYIEWLEQYGFLKNLFDIHAKINTVDHELLLWIVCEMLAKYPQEVLALVERNGAMLNREFCWSVHLLLAYGKNGVPEDSIFRTWITILLSQPHTSLSRQDWSLLLPPCLQRGDKYCAILIFDFLTQPHLVLRRSWNFPVMLEDDEPKRLVDYEIDIGSHAEYYLSKSWKDFFRPHLSEIADYLEPLVTSHLRSAHTLLLLNGKANDEFDGLCFSRQTIKYSGQFPKLYDTLVDAGRDIVEFMMERDLSQGVSLIGRWFRSGVPILRRLAIHGMTGNQGLSADEKIRWILDQDLLFRSGFKTEVFELLRISYPSLTSEVKQLLLNVTLIGPQGKQAENISDDTKEYEIYNLLIWLTKIAPECDLARRALDSVRVKHPHFAAREHPDLNFWTSGFKSVGAKFNVEEILTKPPGEFLDQIGEISPDASLGERRGDSVSALMSLVSKNPDWGFDLQTELIRRGVSDSDIWTQVFNGWREASLNQDAWSKWFDEINQFPMINLISAKGIADIFEARGIRKEEAIPDDLMERAYELSKRVWLILDKHDQSEAPKDNDWLGLAINRSSGKLARFWLEYISALRKRLGEQWTGLPVSVGNFLESVITSKSKSAGLAQVIIASQLHYFYSLDAEFSQRFLLPLFDWIADPLRAIQSWTGYLGWGRWQKTYLDEMLPFYKETLSHIKEFPTRYGESFANHIAEIAIFGRMDALENDWLLSFILLFGADLRAHFAEAVEQLLNEMDVTPASELWNRWFRRYWEDRVAAKPVSLETREMNFVARWPLCFIQDFGEAVDLLFESPKAALLYSLSEEELKKLEYLCEESGESVADYLLIVLPSLNSLHERDTVLSIVRKLREKNVSISKIAKLDDELLRIR